MKSLCLSIDQLHILRETIQLSPHAETAEKKGYSSTDLDSLDEVCAAIDQHVGLYRKLRRGIVQSGERQMREIRKVEDRVERGRLAQMANDDVAERLEGLDAEQHTDQLAVLSLEGNEMNWLQENWRLRADWNGADEWRARIRAITAGLKPENVIEWKAGEKEPLVSAFDRSKASEASANGHATVEELSAAVAR